ncbi:MAG: presqualene diphosphate synthase HpnD [Rhodospirillales bacterium]|nr:presqualene diphosphate synthase HpnD [Rhodospirillales bacterium]
MTLTQPISEAAEAGSEAEIEAIVLRAGSSFYWAMRRLPDEKRRAMYAIYAFCREVDDIADEPGAIDEKRAGLAMWRGEIERLYGEQPRHLISRALLGPVEKYGILKNDFRDVIDGMETDAQEAVRIASMAELETYCDRVASAVGRMSVRVFGVPESLGVRLADAQGQALQLTNILRDVKEDAGRNRLYIPRDLLISHDIDADDIDAVIADPALADVCELLSLTAARRYAEARDLIKQCRRDQVRPAIMMMEVYSQILDKLMRRGWRDLSKPVHLSKIEKAWTALRFGLL